MRVSIMQPAYLPWLGYFERIAMSDLHIVLDHVQIDRNSKTKFANRNKVRVGKSWIWLTVPLKTKGKGNDLPIDELEIDNESRWAAKHWKTLELEYKKAPFFPAHSAFFERAYGRVWSHLAELNRETTEYLMRQCLHISTPVVFSAKMQVPGAKDELILNLCKSVQATEYISGPFGREYLNSAAFEQAGIKLVFHDYAHPVYPQIQGGFEPYMSALDLVFNCGEQAQSILRTNPGLL